jgi:hypothetical protein
MSPADAGNGPPLAVLPVGPRSLTWIGSSLPQETS